MLQKKHIIQQTGMLEKLSTCLRVAASAKAGGKVWKHPCLIGFMQHQG